MDYTKIIITIVLLNVFPAKQLVYILTCKKRNFLKTFFEQQIFEYTILKYQQLKFLLSIADVFTDRCSRATQSSQRDIFVSQSLPWRKDIRRWFSGRMLAYPTGSFPGRRISFSSAIMFQLSPALHRQKKIKLRIDRCGQYIMSGERFPNNISFFVPIVVQLNYNHSSQLMPCDCGSQSNKTLQSGLAYVSHKLLFFLNANSYRANRVFEILECFRYQHLE